MEIKLISKTPNYLRTCWTAARTCYSADSPIELLTQEKTDEEMLRLLDRIMKSKHLSVVEHCAMTFAVKDVSRTLLAQYSRHRIGVSLSVQSQRYVSEQSSKQAGGLFGHVVPQTIMENGEAHVRYMDCMKAIQAAYDDLLTLGVAKQDARFVLPGGACTNFVTALLHGRLRKTRQNTGRTVGNQRYDAPYARSHRCRGTMARNIYPACISAVRLRIHIGTLRGARA